MRLVFILQINGTLLLCIHVCIAIITLQSSKELLGLSCCFPLASPLAKYLFNMTNVQ